MLWSRDPERAAVDRLIERLRDGRGGGLVLRGEPGIGKTALLGYARERAAGLGLLTASAGEAEADLAYATLHQLLRPVLGRIERLPAPQAAALRVALGLAAGAAPDRFLVALAVLTLLADLAGERPLVCLVDDAQWADAPSFEALAFLARRLGADPIVLLVAVRGEAGAALTAAGLAEARLGALDAAAAARVLDARWGGAIAPAVRASLVRAAGGNPLGLLELPASLSGPQLAGEAPLPEPLPLPEELERLFLERVHRLDGTAQTLLLLCAAAGAGDDSAPATLVRAAAALGVDAPLERLAALPDLLTLGGGGAAFRHPLVRSAVYQGAPAEARRAAHRALAGALADTPAEDERRVWHLARAALGPDETVAAALEAAAARTLRRAGAAAAATILEAAAALSPDGAARGRRLGAAAGAAWQGGDAGRACALLDRAGREGPVTPDGRLHLQYLRGTIELRAGIPADAAGILLDVAPAAVAADPGLALLLLGTAGEAAFQAGDQAASRRVRELMAGLPVGDPGAALLKRLYLAVIPLTWGQRPAAAGLEDADTAGQPAAAGGTGVSSAAGLDDAELLARAGGMAFGLGRFALARRLGTRAVALARARGAAGTLTWALLPLAMDEVVRSRFPWAEANAAEGRALARESGQPNLALQHEAILAELAALRGQEPEPGGQAETVLAAATGRGLHGTAAMARRALGLLALARGRPDEALGHLEALWDLPGGQQGIAFSTVPDLVEAGVRAGRPDPAGERLPPYLAWAGSSGAPAAQALAARARALLAGGAAADALYRQALAAHATTDRLLDRARTALLYGEFLRRERRRVDAREPLRLALETFERIGAPHWAERARGELRATGESARKRDPSTLDRLTQQELQVVRVVSQGATNREAAAQLFISPRTVDHHLRGAFRKLGIGSRAELIRLALAGDTPTRPAQGA